MTSVDSVKRRLLNIAKREERNYQELLTMYGIECFLLRLSKSRYARNFILKGGILMYALFDSKLPRSTSDIDFLCKDLDFDPMSIDSIIKEICLIEHDDFIWFDSNSSILTYIKKLNDFQGINVSCFAFLEKTRIRISVDIGFGDVIVPQAEEVSFSTILDCSNLILYAYSKETIIAEKYHAIVSFGRTNSRIKDVYDIYLLSRNFDFDKSTLKSALEETFRNRKTSIRKSQIFENNYIDDMSVIYLWENFKRIKSIREDLDLTQVIGLLRLFLIPVIESIESQKDYDKKWNHILQFWE